MTTTPASGRIDALQANILALTRAIEREAAEYRAAIDESLPAHRRSALNLAHYLGLRRQDIRGVQCALNAMGLSSLGRCEGHVHDTLLRVDAWLAGERATAMAASIGESLDSAQAEKILHANTQALFGARPRDRHVYIMVTAPDAAAATPAWADELLHSGMDILRVNGAHESPHEWAAIVSTFKSRAAALGRPGRVFVDLPGPKLRSEIRDMEESVLHLRRNKDRRGRTVTPTSVQLVAEYGGGDNIPVPAAWLSRLRPSDVISLTDAGGRDRSLFVTQAADGRIFANCDRSLYVVGGLPLVWRRGETRVAEGCVGTMPGAPTTFELRPGGAFLLNDNGHSADMAVPALALPEAWLLDQVRLGERVILDDGRLVAVVEAVSAAGLVCRVQYALKSPTRLRTGKGIAFPDSELTSGRIAAQDEAALAFALDHADGVGVSFVNSPSDVTLIGERLRAARRPGFGMILKIETRGAMRNLAAILFAALRYEPVGLMIARGDLAVELSFERLAEMQEELLWLGEACHLPVIWATQVLDTAAHTGLPTRAEVTDAAMSMRAECVMLNKGPYVATATRMLADIIRKMETHQYKKLALDRRLSVAGSAR